jgi:hypothetical protein
MRKIIFSAFVIILFGIIVSFTTTKNVQAPTKTEIVYINGMKYVVFHSNGTIQVANVTKDLLEIEAYKRK